MRPNSADPCVVRFAHANKKLPTAMSTPAALASSPRTDAVEASFSDESIRRRIAEYDRWFVHTNFGNGIIARSTSWPDQPLDSRHAGDSKFDFIVRRNLPDLQGKRILEIGCNAGVISIHIARLGAAEVVGIDCERGWPRWKEQAEFLKSALEWRCRTKYNVRYVECDMVALPEVDLGRFDAVIALNCIYYIQEDQIRRLTHHVASITDHFVVQCNTRDHKGLGRRRHPGFIRSILLESGFPVVNVDWPWDRPRKRFWPQRYCRPIVAGHRSNLEPPRT